MRIARDSLRIDEVCNGCVLRGTTDEGEEVFLAHLGDGADGLPDPDDLDLAEAYGFELAPVLVKCPECAGNGVIFSRATPAAWAGLIPWPGDMRGAPCGFCEGSGQVTLEERRWYELALADSRTD